MNAWWDEFREWQKSYNTNVHGILLVGQYLSTQAFRTGGVNGHLAPECPLCKIATISGISVSRSETPDEVTPVEENILETPISNVKPVCEFCNLSAKFFAPQSTDAGKTIHRWVPICDEESKTWWDGSDWIGTFTSIANNTGYVILDAMQARAYGPMNKHDANLLVRPEEIVLQLTPLSVR